MSKNKIFTSVGNVTFVYENGKSISVHPEDIYVIYNSDTMTVLPVEIRQYNGIALFASEAEDVEINGINYSSEELPKEFGKALGDAAAHARAEVVDVLPQVGDVNTIYFTPKTNGNGYDEYIYLKEKSKWELIGDTDIELARYATKVELQEEYTRAKTAENTLNVAIVAEISRAEQAENKLKEDIEAEKTRAKTAEQTLNTSITNEVNRATAAENDLQNNINDEKTRAEEAEQALNTSINNEIARSTEKDTTHDTLINGLVTSLGNEVNRATAAENDLQSNINDEKTRAEQAEQTLNTAINDEITRSTEKDTNHDTLINGLTTSLGNEVNRATEAENGLQGDINTVSSDLQSEITRAKGVESGILESIESIDDIISDIETNLGGITLLKISQEDYDALEEKDNNVLYIVE